MKSRRKLTLPLTLTAGTLLACSPSPLVDAAASDVGAEMVVADVASADTGAEDASCTRCTPVTEPDSSVLRYTVCSSTTMGCACVIYPDGGVVDPTFF